MLAVRASDQLDTIGVLQDNYQILEGNHIFGYLTPVTETILERGSHKTGRIVIIMIIDTDYVPVTRESQMRRPHSEGIR